MLLLCCVSFLVLLAVQAANDSTNHSTDITIEVATVTYQSSELSRSATEDKRSFRSTAEREKKGGLEPEGSAEERLEKSLFETYNKYTRPVKNSRNPVLVWLDAQLYKILEVNEREEFITQNIWMRMQWLDEGLTWDPSSFGGVTETQFSSEKIWLPDIGIHGTLEVTPGMDFHSAKVRCNSSGYVYWSRPLNLKVHCNFDVNDFPFDEQHCLFQYTSWAMTDNKLRLDIFNAKGAADVYERNSEWTLQNYTGEQVLKRFVTGNFSEVHYYLQLKRKPQYYRITIILPSCLITIISLIGLHSPFNHRGDREEKVGMGLTTLLTMAVLLMVVTEQMPKTSDGFPVMGRFLMFELICSSFATLSAVVVMYLHYGCMHHRVPGWVRHMFRVPRRPPKERRREVVREEESARIDESIGSAPICVPEKLENWLMSSSYYDGNSNSTKPEKVPLLNCSVVESQIEEIRAGLDRQWAELDEARDWTTVFSRIDVCCLLFYFTLNVTGTLVLLHNH